MPAPGGSGPGGACSAGIWSVGVAWSRPPPTATAVGGVVCILLECILVAIINMDIFQMTLKLSSFTVDF